MNENNSTAGYRKLQLGDIDAYILTDGWLSENSAHFSPRANIAELKNILADNFRSTEIIKMAMNVLLVKTKDRLILFDTGMGIFSSNVNTGMLLKSLQLAGFAANDITDVFISHAHPDHIGGIVNEHNELVFPNADIFIAKTEYDFWQQATLKDFDNSALRNEPEFLNMFIPKVQNILNTIKSKLKFYDFNQTLYGHFNFQLAPGHTPGMTLTTISSNKEKLMYIADLIHSDIILFKQPEWGFHGDTDLDKAIASRVQVLQQLAASKLKALGYHLPYPGLGFVKAETEKTFEWAAESFVTP